MIITTINDHDSIETFQRDIKAMESCLKMLKRSKAIAKKVSVAFKAGRISEEKKDEMLSNIAGNMTDALVAIQSHGLALGCGDEGDWEGSSGIIAHHIVTKATK